MPNLPKVTINGVVAQQIDDHTVAADGWTAMLVSLDDHRRRRTANVFRDPSLAGGRPPSSDTPALKKRVDDLVRLRVPYADALRQVATTEQGLTAAALRARINRLNRK